MIILNTTVTSTNLLIPELSEMIGKNVVITIEDNKDKFDKYKQSASNFLTLSDEIEIDEESINNLRETSKI